MNIYFNLFISNNSVSQYTNLEIHYLNIRINGFQMFKKAIIYIMYYIINSNNS